MQLPRRRRTHRCNPELCHQARKQQKAKREATAAESEVTNEGKEDRDTKKGSEAEGCRLGGIKKG